MNTCVKWLAIENNTADWPLHQLSRNTVSKKKNCARVENTWLMNQFRWQIQTKCASLPLPLLLVGFGIFVQMCFFIAHLSAAHRSGGGVVVVVSFVEMWMKWHKVRSREAKKKKKLDFNISSRCGNEYSYHSSLTNRISIARMTSTCFDSNAIRICSPFQQRTQTHRNQRSIISPFIFILLQWWSCPLVVYIITLPLPSVSESPVLFGWFKEYDNKVCYCFAILSTAIHPTTAAAARSGCRTKLLGFGFELRFSSVLS